MVAGISEIRDGICHGSRTGSNSETAHAAFEGSYSIFEDTLCGVGQTAVDVAGIFEMETVGGMLCVMEDVRGGLVDWYRTGIGCGICLFLAYMKLKSLKMKFFLVAHNLFPF